MSGEHFQHRLNLGQDILDDSFDSLEDLSEVESEEYNSLVKLTSISTASSRADHI